MDNSDQRLRYLLAALLVVALLVVGGLPSAAQEPDTGPYHLVTTLGRGAVRSVAWSPAGNMVAVGGALGIWLYTPDLDDLGLLKGHRRAVYGLAFNPEGTRLASASHDGTVRVWHLDLQTELFTLEGHSGRVVAVAWSPDGAVIASASHDHTVRLWDPSAGTALHVLEGHTGWVNQVAFSPAGDRVISAGYDGTIRVWDRESGAPIEQMAGSAAAWNQLTGQPEELFIGPHAEFRFKAWSPDGSRYAMIHWDDALWVLDSASESILAVRDEHTDWITALTWASENRLMSDAVDPSVRLWDVDTSILVNVTLEELQRAEFPAASPDGSRLVTLDAGGTVRVVDAQTGSLIAELPGLATTAAWSPGGRLAVAQRNGTITIWSE